MNFGINKSKNKIHFFKIPNLKPDYFLHVIKALRGHEFFSKTPLVGEAPVIFFQKNLVATDGRTDGRTDGEVNKSFTPEFFFFFFSNFCK